MRILLFGENGQLGWELKHSLKGLGQVLSCDCPEVDFLKPVTIRMVFEDSRPDVVVNAAAYTNVDRAEGEPELAKCINTDAPALVAELCRERHAGFIHYSTDYVFDGQTRTPYRESDIARPVNVYGRTKLDGDRAIMEIGGDYLILRTAWVYGTRRPSYISKVLGWARRQREMRVVVDQVSNPTWARALADVTAGILQQAGPDPRSSLTRQGGLYHIAGRGVASRFDWAKAIIMNDPNKDEQVVEKILPAKSAEFPTAARRPSYSALDCGKFERTFSLKLPEWRAALERAMAEI